MGKVISSKPCNFMLGLRIKLEQGYSHLLLYLRKLTVHVPPILSQDLCPWSAVAEAAAREWVYMIS
jgi:hypothetical protein